MQLVLAFLAGAERLDIDHVAGARHLSQPQRILRARRPHPFGALDGNDADLPVPNHRAARLARRLQADAGGLVAGFEHDREAPADIGEGPHVGELDAPVAADAAEFDLGHRAAIAPSLVIAHEAVGERLVRDHLHLGIEGGAHRQPALIEPLLAVFFQNLAAHVLGEIVGGEDVRAGRALGDGERLLLRLLAGIGGDVAVLDQALDDVIAPLDRAIAIAERVQVGGRLGKRGQIGRLRNGQFIHRLVEIEQRGGRDAIGAKSRDRFR